MGQKTLSPGVLDRIGVNQEERTAGTAAHSPGQDGFLYWVTSAQF